MKNKSVLQLRLEATWILMNTIQLWFDRQMHDYLILKYLRVVKVRREPFKESSIVSVHNIYGPIIYMLTQLRLIFDNVFDRWPW